MNGGNPARVGFSGARTRGWVPSEPKLGQTLPQDVRTSEFAFPHYEDIVPRAPQGHDLFLVALGITPQFSAPERVVSVRYATSWTILVMMPEAAMHESCFPASLVGDVRGSRKTPHVPPIPSADRPKHLADRIFRGGPFSPHPFHERGSVRSGLDPGHTLGQILSTMPSRRSSFLLAFKYSEYASSAPRISVS